MRSASTSTTIIIPDQSPALNMPSIAAQLVRVVARNATMARGRYFFIVIDFVSLITMKP